MKSFWKSSLSIPIIFQTVCNSETISLFKIINQLISTSFSFSPTKKKESSPAPLSSSPRPRHRSSHPSPPPLTVQPQLQYTTYHTLITHRAPPSLRPIYTSARARAHQLISPQTRNEWSGPRPPTDEARRERPGGKARRCCSFSSASSSAAASRRSRDTDIHAYLLYIYTHARCCAFSLSVFFALSHSPRRFFLHLCRVDGCRLVSQRERGKVRVSRYHGMWVGWCWCVSECRVWLRRRWRGKDYGYVVVGQCGDQLIWWYGG